MRILPILLAFSLAACGGKSKPAPAPSDDTTEETPDDTDDTGDSGEAKMYTPEECEAEGGMVKGDIGDGSVACDEGWVETGNVSGGVEAQLCCVPAN